MFNDETKTGPEGVQSDNANRTKVAVDAKRGTVFHMSPHHLTVLGVDTDDDVGPAEIARRRAPLDPQLVANMRTYGVTRVVEAYKRGERVIVNDGNRRTLHARAAHDAQIAAGEPPLSITVMLVKADDTTLYARARVHNRFAREEGPLASAFHAQHLAGMGRSTADIALTMGVAEQTVLNWATTLALHPDVIKAIEEEVISPTAAMALAPVERSEQVTELAAVLKEAQAVGRKPSVARVKARVEKRTGRSAGLTPSDRVKRAAELLAGAALWSEREASKDACWTLLEKLAKVVTGKTMARLYDEQQEGK